MDPLTIGALITGGTALVGGLFSQQGQRDANAQNAQQAAENRHFQDVMSTQAHQREVNDLKAAGLNPILSAGGSGAQALSGSTSVAQNANEGMTASALEAVSIFQQMKKQKEEIELLKAQTDKTKNESKVISKDIPKADMINEIYDTFGKPVINKIKQMKQDSASMWREYQKDSSQSSKTTGRGLRLRKP